MPWLVKSYSFVVEGHRERQQHNYTMGSNHFYDRIWISVFLIYFQDLLTIYPTFEKMENMKSNNAWNKVAFKFKNMYDSRIILAPFFSRGVQSSRDVTYDKGRNQSSIAHLSHDLYVSIEFNQVCWRQAVLSSSSTYILAFHAVSYIDSGVIAWARYLTVWFGFDR